MSLPFRNSILKSILMGISQGAPTIKSSGAQDALNVMGDHEIDPGLSTPTKEISIKIYSRTPCSRYIEKKSQDMMKPVVISGPTESPAEVINDCDC